MEKGKKQENEDKENALDCRGKKILATFGKLS